MKKKIIIGLLLALVGYGIGSMLPYRGKEVIGQVSGDESVKSVTQAPVASVYRFREARIRIEVPMFDSNGNWAQDGLIETLMSELPQVAQRDVLTAIKAIARSQGKIN